MLFLLKSMYMETERMNYFTANIQEAKAGGGLGACGLDHDHCLSHNCEGAGKTLGCHDSIFLKLHNDKEEISFSSTLNLYFHSLKGKWVSRERYGRLESADNQ